MASVEIPEGLEELFQQTWFDHVLHYALLVGAVFQIVCIAAIVFLPASDEEQSIAAKKDSSGASDSREGVAQVVKGSGPLVQASSSVSKKAASKKAKKRR